MTKSRSHHFFVYRASRRRSGCQAPAIAVVKWASLPLACSPKTHPSSMLGVNAWSGLLRQCTRARVPVEQSQSRSGFFNQLANFFARFEEGNSLRWHLDPSAGLWIASRATTPLSRVESAESPNLHLVAGSQRADDPVRN